MASTSILKPYRWLLVGACLAGASVWAADEPGAPEGWSTQSPRDELRPAFRYEPAGGPSDRGSFVIEAGECEGLIGGWAKVFPVKGGRYAKFSVKRKAEGMATPRQAAVVRIVWQDERGKPVRRDKPTFASYRPGDRPIAEPEFPADQGTDAQGWTEVGAVYHVPAEAARALVELQYRWAPKGRVEWADVSLEETATPPPRRVRLATVHLRPAK